MVQIKDTIENISRDTTKRNLIAQCFDTDNENKNRNVTLSNVNVALKDDKEMLEIAKSVFELQKYPIAQFKETASTEISFSEK